MLASWLDLRTSMNIRDSFQMVIDYWNAVPLTSHVGVLDPYYQTSWPTPWDIIARGKFDDFTKTVMIGYTFLLSLPYRNSTVEIRTYEDNIQNRLYNVAVLDNTWVFNLNDNNESHVSDIPEHFKLENLVQLQI